MGPVVLLLLLGRKGNRGSCLVCFHKCKWLHEDKMLICFVLWSELDLSEWTSVIFFLKFTYVSYVKVWESRWRERENYVLQALIMPQFHFPSKQAPQGSWPCAQTPRVISNRLWFGPTLGHMTSNTAVQLTSNFANSSLVLKFEDEFACFPNISSPKG